MELVRATERPLSAIDVSQEGAISVPTAKRTVDSATGPAFRQTWDGQGCARCRYRQVLPPEPEGWTEVLSKPKQEPESVFNNPVNV